MLFKNLKSKFVLKDISKKVGWSTKKVETMLNKAKEYGISEEEYIEQKYYLVPIKKISKQSRSMNASIIAEKHSAPYGEVYVRMQHAKKEYGISNYMFAKRDLFLSSDDELEAFANDRNKRTNDQYKTICNTTNEDIDTVRENASRIMKMHSISFAKYFFNRLYLYSDEQIAEIINNWNEEKEGYINTIQDNTGWDREKILYDLKKCDFLYGVDANHYVLFKFWDRNEEERKKYVTINTSTKLTNKYNGPGRKYLINKALFDEKFQNLINRKFWVNRNTSYEEFCEFVDGVDEIFCKPSDSSKARGAEKIKVEGDLKELYESLIQREKLLVEECVKQHPEMNKLYPGSINTIRAITILKDGKYNLVFTVVKIGNGGIVDNLVGGGVVAAVDSKTGKIITDAVDTNGNVYKTHPITGTEFKGFQIPCWDRLIEVSEQALKVVSDVNYVGWDIAINDKDDISIIEGNSRPDLGLCQIPMAIENIGLKELFESYL